MSAMLYGGLAALQLAGGYFAAQNIKETAALNADIADLNAEFAELDAFDAELEGFTEQARYQKVVDETISSQRLAFAAADVDVTFGSAADVERESRFIADLNKMEIQKQAQEKALGFKLQARDFRIGSFLTTAQAKVQASAVKFGAITGAAQTGLSGYSRSRS